MRKVDVCGLNCPEPVLIVKRLMDENEGEIEVVSDAAVAVENITRLCLKRGYVVSKSEKGGLFMLKLTEG